MLLHLQKNAALVLNRFPSCGPFAVAVIPTVTVCITSFSKDWWFTIMMFPVSSKTQSVTLRKIHFAHHFGKKKPTKNHKTVAMQLLTLNQHCGNKIDWLLTELLFYILRLWKAFCFLIKLIYVLMTSQWWQNRVEQAFLVKTKLKQRLLTHHDKLNLKS